VIRAFDRVLGSLASDRQEAIVHFYQKLERNGWVTFGDDVWENIRLLAGWVDRKLENFEGEPVDKMEKQYKVKVEGPMMGKIEIVRD
jgi:hypothetical protein